MIVLSIELATKYVGYVDEVLTTEAKYPLVTSTASFDWDGAQTVKIYKVSSADMTDYGRDGPAEGDWSRYGSVGGLNATTEVMKLTKDRSFSFAIDKLDVNETAGALDAAQALARQLREKVIPEIDSYVLTKMCSGAGVTPSKTDLYADNVYQAILAASEALDAAEVPETGRVLLVTPAVYTLLKLAKEVIMETDPGQEMRKQGVLGYLDGAVLVKVPATRVPSGFGFMLCHPMATVAPVKLADYRIHQDPPGLSGSLVEGRFCYDAFVLDNKASAIAYQTVYVYTAVKTADLDVDDIGTYYELVNGKYALTEDESLTEGKTYYTRA